MAKRTVLGIKPGENDFDGVLYYPIVWRGAGEGAASSSVDLDTAGGPVMEAVRGLRIVEADAATADHACLVDLLVKSAAQVQSALSRHGAQRLLLLVQFGRLLRVLKKKVRGEKGKWSEYALRFDKIIGEDVRGDAMRLARIPMIEDALEYGQARLIRILVHVEKVQNDRPIQYYLAKHSLDFIPKTKESKMYFDDELKKLEASMFVKAHGVELDEQRLEKLVKVNAPLDEHFMSRCKEEKMIHGSCDEFVDMVADNDGKVVTTLSSNAPKESLTVLSAKIKNRIKYMIEYRDFGESIDVRFQVESLVSALSSLLTAYEQQEAP